VTVFAGLLSTTPHDPMMAAAIISLLMPLTCAARLTQLFITQGAPLYGNVDFRLIYSGGEGRKLLTWGSLCRIGCI
jgi:hypothetical protein